MLIKYKTKLISKQQQFTQIIMKFHLAVTVIISPVVLSGSLGPESSWSCGVFVTNEAMSPPQGQYYQLPSQLTDCPAKFRDTWKRGKFAKKCGRLGKEWESNWVLGSNEWESSWTPLVSILSTGKYTSDVCSIVKSELGLDNVPGEEIEQPLQFGYFYTYCGEEEWKDTGVRSDAMICCQVSPNFVSLS